MEQIYRGMANGAETIDRNFTEANNKFSNGYGQKVGDIHISIDSANPSARFGGTWQRFANGRTLVGVDEADNATLMKTANNQGGSINPLTSHEHSMGLARGTNPNASSGGTGGYSWAQTNESDPSSKRTFGTGGNTNHNNWQPFVTVYMWVRTA